MAATPEKKIKTKVVVQLKELGAYYFYPVTSGFGASGVPDIIACYKGKFFGFECKANGNKPTALQQLNIDRINGSGGTALVINEDNMDKIKEILES
jgi:Holliday junction resolvase